MLTIRVATVHDIPCLQTLIANSIRKLGVADYTSEQIDLALQGAFGVDTQLINDGTYFVVVQSDAIIGCGGWSRRKTLFGSDQRANRDDGFLDPINDAAKIRAFFVDPTRARMGVGSLLLSHCEAQATLHGFQSFELMATLPGVRLYERRGYQAGEPIEFPLSSHITIRFVPMRKSKSIGA